MNSKRILLRAVCAGLAFCGGWSVSHAASKVGDYPNRPITLVVPYPPGGSADMATRIVAAELSKEALKKLAYAED